LFELCKQQEWPSSHEHIRKRIAQLATPILVNRCKITLRKYIADELKSGTLPKTRVQDAGLILRKLHDLECGDRSYLVELMPVFADMVMTNERELKEAIRKILYEISESLANKGPLARQSSGGTF